MDMMEMMDDHRMDGRDVCFLSASPSLCWTFLFPGICLSLSFPLCLSMDPSEKDSSAVYQQRMLCVRVCVRVYCRLYVLLSALQR